MPGTGNATQMLADQSGGHRGAVEQLMPLVHGELRRLAQRYLRSERANHTLQPTALVHEAYLRLIDQTDLNWKNRAHFIGIAAHLMRQILVNHAIHHKRAKRGGGEYTLTLEDAAGRSSQPDVDLMTLDDALHGLAAIDAQQSQIVELRFFGGLTVEETAEALGVSTGTVKREWRTAKAWLHAEMSSGDGPWRQDHKR